MKKTVVISLLAIVYIWGLVHGYAQPLRAGRMFATALLYIMMHYVTLSRRSAVHRYGQLIAICVGAIGLVIWVVSKNIRLTASSVLWHAALFSVVYSLEDIISNRRKFRPGQFFRTGGTLFSIFFTLSFITAFIGRNQEFSLTCNDIMDASTSVVRYTQNGLTAGIHQIPTRGESGSAEPDFFDVLQDYKTHLIDETIMNQKSINEKVCGVFLEQIKDLYTKPGFRISVILLMFLFLSPLLRISLFVISWLNILIFTLLKKAKVYSIGKETVEVDKVM